MPLTVRDVLAMATKYQADALRARIVKHVEADWGTNWSTWNMLDAHIEETTLQYNKLERLFLDDDTMIFCLDDRLPEPASAIRLARDFNILSILPAAFYHLASLKVTDDWDRMRTMEDPDGLLIRSRTQRTARWSMLTGEDWLCLQRGKEALKTKGALILTSGHGRATCPGKIEIPYAEELEGEGGLLRHVRKLIFQYEPNVGGPGSVDTCGLCADQLAAMLHDHGTDFWDELRDCFELPAELPATGESVPSRNLSCCLLFHTWLTFSMNF